MKLPLSLAAALTMSALIIPEPAHACGGFFCSQVPVEQSGEQILFGMAGGKVTAQILINYTGAAEAFAWVLPVASVPEITLGSFTTFQSLGSATQPSWRLDWQTTGAQCNWWWVYPMAASEDDASGGGRNDVTVVAQKQVGPFETAVLESSSTDDLIQWLDDNGYDQPPESRRLIDHYVRQDMVFVALRLAKDEPTGAIQPITLTFQEADPCVPLVLTQVAATPDMPVQIFLASEHRVVPTNWLSVTLNEKKIDWLNGGANYTDVVSQAIDEASGRAFVTEYAGAATFSKSLLYREGQYDLAALAAAGTPEDFVMLLLQQGFPRDAQMQNLMRKHIPMPQALIDRGLTEQQFYNDLGSYAADLEAAGFVFDAAAFVADLEARVVTPLRETQALLDSHPYFTRLLTTVSPDEMTRDPVFTQNPQLGDISNLHSATATPSCGSDPNAPPESVLIELADGQTFTISGPFTQSWPIIDYPDPAPDEPAARTIELIGATGEGTSLHRSQVQAVDQALDTQDPNSVLADLANGAFPATPLPSEGGSSSGCSQGELVGGIALAIFILSLAFRKKRHG